MTLVWLRVALVFYAAGLLYALVALARTSSTSETLGKIALHASYLGMVFHFVSLTEAVVQTGQIATASVHNSESLLAFLIMVGFMIAYLVYKTTTPGIVIFPWCSCLPSWPPPASSRSFSPRLLSSTVGWRCIS